MTELGHVVFYVRDLEKSVHFYEKAVGLVVKGRIFNDQAVILTGGRSHHELLLIEVGEATGPLKGRRIGLYHVGWKIGEDLETLRKKREQLISLGYPPEAMSDHGVSQSLYPFRIRMAMRWNSS